MIARREFLRMSAVLSLFPFLLPATSRAAGVAQLTLAGPPAPLSLPLARLAQDPAVTADIPTIEMRQWRNPDIMRSWVVSGEVQVSAVPANAAAILYNKGLPVRLLDVNNGGILSLLSSDPAVKTFADIKGKSVLLFYRGDIPDMIVRFLAAKQGLDVDKDMTVAYVDSPFEALQMLLSGRATTVLLPEPAATAAEMKGKQAGKRFNRIMLQDVWAQATGSKLFMPLGGTLCQAALATEHPETVKAVLAGMDRAVAWINANPAEAGKAFAGMFGLKAPVLEHSLKRFPVRRAVAADARKDVEFYYKALMGMSAKLVGGKLPDDAFYLG